LKSKAKKEQLKTNSDKKQIGYKQQKNNFSKQKRNTHNLKTGTILLSSSISTSSKPKISISRAFPVWMD